MKYGQKLCDYTYTTLLSLDSLRYLSIQCVTLPKTENRSREPISNRSLTADNCIISYQLEKWVKLFGCFIHPIVINLS